jgi:hypothetical protein
MPKQTVLETLSPSDIDGRYAVIVKIRPEMPQDRMVKAQLAQAYRTPGADGRPLLDDKTILEDIIEADYPDTVDRRIDAQFLPAESPDIKKFLIAAREQQWIEDHPDTMKLVDKRLGEQINLRPEELQQIIAIAVKQALGAQGAQQLLAAGDAAASGQPVQMPPGGFGAPAGPDPSTLPSQMQMSPEQALPNPQELAASQERRGRPQQPF